MRKSITNDRYRNGFVISDAASVNRAVGAQVSAVSTHVLQVNRRPIACRHTTIAHTPLASICCRSVVQHALKQHTESTTVLYKSTGIEIQQKSATNILTCHDVVQYVIRLVRTKSTTNRNSEVCA